MPSAYLAQNEYVDYGVPSTSPQSIAQASAVVDAYLRRREGLQYMTDAAGLPAYMAGLSPTVSLTIAGGVPSGVNVVVPVIGALSLTGNLGDVVILDRAVKASTEAAVITAVTANTITLAKVSNSHPSNTTVDFGLVITEQQPLPAKRSIARATSWPIVRLINAMGAYRYGRRVDQNAGTYADTNFLSMMQTFGGPPAWNAIDVTTTDYNAMTGEVWVPSGMFLAYYSDVRLYYVAGYTQSNIPPIIKQATAAIIKANLNTGDLVGGVKKAQAGGTVIERFSNTILSLDERAELDLYRAKLMA